MSTLLSTAFFLAIVSASFDTSIAVISANGKLFFKEIGIHPLPVPISNIFNCFSFAFV